MSALPEKWNAGPAMRRVAASGRMAVLKRSVPVCSVRLISPRPRRLPRALRKEVVRLQRPVHLDPAPVVARGRHGGFLQREDRMGRPTRGIRRLDCDGPCPLRPVEGRACSRRGRGAGQVLPERGMARDPRVATRSSKPLRSGRSSSGRVPRVVRAVTRLVGSRAGSPTRVQDARRRPRRMEHHWNRANYVPPDVSRKARPSAVAAARSAAFSIS